MSSRRRASTTTRGGADSSSKSAAASASAAGSKRRRADNDSEDAPIAEDQDEQQQNGAVSVEDEEAEAARAGGNGAASDNEGEESQQPRSKKPSRAQSRHRAEGQADASSSSSSHHHTPAHSRSASHHQASPSLADSMHAYSPLIRTSRLAEKAELSALNKRLELYILRQRERDAAQTGLDREISLLRSKFIAEQTSDKKRHEARYDELKKQKLELGVALHQLRDEHLKTGQGLKDATGESQLYKARCVEMEKRIKKMESELTEVGQARIALDGQAKKLTIDLAEETEARSLLASQLESQKTSLALAQKQLNIIQTKFNTTLQDLEMLQSSSKEELAALTRQVSVLTRENQAIEEKLRREFGAQLKALLAERQQQYEEEKEEAMTQLKNFYETSLQEKSAALAEVQKDVDRAQSQVKTIARELAAERKSNAHVAALRAEYEHTITSLHEAAESSRSKFDRDLAAKEAQVRAQAQALNDKDREFATLMDVKIKLDMEIKQYDKLLDHEESRLGFVDANHPSVMGIHAAARGSSPAPAAASRAARRESAGGAVVPKSGRKGRGAAAAAAASAVVEEESEESSSMNIDHSSSSSASQLVHSSSSSSRRGGRGGGESSNDASSAAAAAGGDSDSFAGLSLSVSPSSKRFTLSNSARIDESNPSAGSIDLSSLTLATSKSKQKTKLAGLEPLAPGQSVTIYTGAAAAAAKPPPSAGNQSMVWEGCNEEEVWSEGEVVQIKEGSKVMHSVRIIV